MAIQRIWRATILPQIRAGGSESTSLGLVLRMHTIDCSGTLRAAAREISPAIDAAYVGTHLLRDISATAS